MNGHQEDACLLPRRHILVVSDLGPAAANALWCAAHLARPQGAALRTPAAVADRAALD